MQIRNTSRTILAAVAATVAGTSAMAMAAAVSYSSTAPSANGGVFHDPVAPDAYTGWALPVRWHGGNGPKNESRGQTFTTTSGYTLDKLVVLQHSIDSSLLDETLYVNVWKLDGVTTNPDQLSDRLTSDLFTGLALGSDQYVTFDITNVDLLPNTVYGFNIGFDTSNENDFEWLLHDSDGAIVDYLAGNRWDIENNLPSTSGIDTIPGTSPSTATFQANDDLVFYAVAVPEPAALSLIGLAVPALLRRRARCS